MVVMSMPSRSAKAALALSFCVLLAGCNSTAQNAPPPDFSASPVENPLPAPPSNTPSPAGAASAAASVEGTAPAGPAAGAPALNSGGPSLVNRPALVSDPGFRLPAGGGCDGATARFQALIDNDLKSGHTTRDVHNEISSELTSLRGRCANGEDTTDEVTLLRQRFGYPSI